MVYTDGMYFLLKAVAEECVIFANNYRRGQPVNSIRSLRVLLD